MNTRKEIALKSIEEAEQRIKDAQRQIELAKKDIEAIDSKPKRFKATYSELYYFHMNGLQISSLAEENNMESREKYILGNYFQSRHHAQRWLWQPHRFATTEKAA